MTICLFIVLMLREENKTEAGEGTNAFSVINQVVTESSQILHIKSSLKWLKMYECMMFMNTFVIKMLRYKSLGTLHHPTMNNFSESSMACHALLLF